MIHADSTPPRWAEAILRSVVRPSDRDSISGDLLEEYREVQRPTLGAFRSGAWYLKHVFSLCWRLLWPCVIPMVALTLVAPLVRFSWNRGLVHVPGVTPLDALVYAWAGYYGVQRTQLIRTGIGAAGATSALPMAIFLTGAAIKEPSLLVIPFVHPYIVVILSIAVSIALGMSLVMGAAGSVIGRWTPPDARREAPRLS